MGGSALGIRGGQTEEKRRMEKGIANCQREKNKRPRETREWITPVQGTKKPNKQNTKSSISA